MSDNTLAKQVVSALIHFLYNFFVYFIFIVPFDLWKKATARLANQRENGGLDLSKSKKSLLLSKMSSCIRHATDDKIPKV